MLSTVSPTDSVSLVFTIEPRLNHLEYGHPVVWFLNYKTDQYQDQIIDPPE